LGAADCWLVTSDADEGGEWSRGGQIEYDVGTSDEFIVPFYVKKVAWRSGSFDSLFSAIAEDAARYVWIGRSDGSIFAPYDGGFDLFALSLRPITDLRGRSGSRLSSTASGL
jgi:hypothetical protein